MLPKKYRLSGFLQTGRSVNGFGLRIIFLENNLSYSRFCLSVKKGVFRTAVLRNRAKRILREWLRKNFGIIRPGFDVTLLISRDDAFLVEVKEREKALLSLFRKAALLKED